jgi:hypothetical protein
MARRTLEIFNDLDQGRLVAGFRSNSSALLPRFTLGDSIPVSYRALRPNPGNAAQPWQEVDLTGQSVRVAIGTPAGVPQSGTFTLAYDGDETTARSFNSTASQVATALNLLPSIIAAGGVTVTQAAVGSYRITFEANGALDAGGITIDAAALYPSIDAVSIAADPGSATTRAVVLIRLETQPAAYIELTDELPPAAAVVTSIRLPSTGVTGIQSIEFSPEAYDGTFTVTVGSDQTGGIPFDVSAADLQAALDAISTGDVTVTGTFPRYTIEGLASAATVDVSGLVVPRGRSGEINTNTAGIIELLRGAAQVNAKFEIELFDNTSGNAWTVLQTDCVVIDDVIGNAPSAETGGPVYVTTSMLADRDAAIIRPFNLGDPNIPQTITVTGITDPAGFSPYEMTRIDDVNGRPSWLGGDEEFEEDFMLLRWESGVWELSINTGDFVSTVTSNEMNPANLTAWGSGIVLGAGNPILTGSEPIGSFIGQQLRWEQVTAGSYKWYIWNGTAWSELALA